MLMYTCGLRVSEAVNLRIDDIDGQRMVVWARNTKGHRDRSIPLPIQTLTQLRLYWRRHRPSTWLFPSRYTTHPHVHCLVTGGGLLSDGQAWTPARDDYLVPVKALSRLFRGIFLDNIRRQFKDIHLPKSIWQKDWVVYCKPAVQGTGTVLNYLARYIHRVAITNSRILSVDNGKVIFRYKDSKDDQTKTMTVSAEEFIRRFLQHVLPAGVHKVRYYGLWSPTHRKNLSKVQQILTQGKSY